MLPSPSYGEALGIASPQLPVQSRHMPATAEAVDCFAEEKGSLVARTADDIDVPAIPH